VGVVTTMMMSNDNGCVMVINGYYGCVINCTKKEWFWCHYFVHNSPMWRVVVGGGVMVKLAIWASCAQSSGTRIFHKEIERVRTKKG